jgi:hypothetical protein
LTPGLLAAAAAASSSASDDVGTGVIAFLVVAAMGVALVFLLRSMNKQFRKIDASPLDPLEPLDPLKPGPGDGHEADGEQAKAPAQTPE